MILRFKTLTTQLLLPMTTLPLLKEIGSPALVRGVGYALLHSLWQGGVLALLLAGALPLLRRQRAELRYATAAGALASLVLAVGLTFGFYYYKASAASGAYLASPMVDYLAAAPPTAPVAATLTLPTAPVAPWSWLSATTQALEAYLPLVVVAWLLGLLLMSGRLAGGGSTQANCAGRVPKPWAASGSSAWRH